VFAIFFVPLSAAFFTATLFSLLFISTGFFWGTFCFPILKKKKDWAFFPSMASQVHSGLWVARPWPAVGVLCSISTFHLGIFPSGFFF